MPRPGLRHAALALLAGCAPVDLEQTEVLPPDAWAPLDPALDPLADHRPADVDCPEAAYGVEGLVFEVETGLCTYLWAGQPIPVAVQEGDRLEALVWHEGLDAAEPAEGHVALLLDGEVLWEEVRAIPEDATFFEVELTLERPAEAGSMLSLHLHNHGFNTWDIADVKLGVAMTGSL